MHDRFQNRFSDEQGSVLIIIFVAIALFGALSYTVSDMIRGGGNPEQINQEKASLAAGDILDYGRSLRQTVQQLKIDGCSAEEVSFTQASGDDYEHSPVTPVTCRIFKSVGGALNYIAPNSESLAPISSIPALQGDWYFPANVCVEDVGDGGSNCEVDGVDNEELIAVLPFIQRTICIEINNRLGITNPSGEPPAESGDGWTDAEVKFTGSFTDNTILNQAGQTQGCFAGSSSNSPPVSTYHYFQVLSAR